MDQKHESKAVSAAASFIATAIIILKHSSESVGIGIRTELERSLHRLGPDHKVEPMTPDAIRSYLGEQFGEEFVVDVVDNKAPQRREPESDLDKRFAALEQRFEDRHKESVQRSDELEAENKRLRAELEAAKKPKGEGGGEGGTSPESGRTAARDAVPQPGGSGGRRNS